MEELQSTEILEQEILEDARKKASRILKTADDTVKANSAEWEKKTTGALAELEKKFAEQGVLAVAEIMAVLPMDKRRAKSERVEGLLNSAVETWYAGLSRERVLGFLKKELAKRLAVCGGLSAGDGCRAVIHKLTRAEAESILKDLSITCQIEEAQSSAAYPEFILENNDMRIYASVGKTVDFFLREKRAELIEALLGKAAEGEGPSC
jgi:vacuolar-type H+-ATPase subunit E/Vma4